MDEVVSLEEWRRRRQDLATEQDERAVHPAGRTHPAGMARLERAVDRLHELVGVEVRAKGRLTPPVETELLAILGELTIDMIPEAAARAERLASRLDTGEKIGT
ncbi:MAG: hypothetical protein ACRDHO_01525 [Actinomycetota bacterium]